MKPKVEEILDLAHKLKKEDVELIQRAYDFAKKAHSGQLRKSGEPYFNHVFATAKNLAELGMKAKTISAGLLHDVIEDTSITEEDIKKEFGEEILSLISGVTKLGTVRYKGIERKVENLRRFFVSMAEDLRVLTIKLADRLHNIETLEHIRPDKQKRIALETLEIYAPLADRLSMGRLKGRLEDAAFRYAYPKEYEEVKKMLLERKDAKERYLIEVRDRLNEKILEAKIKNTKIDYRQKHLYSLWKKLQKYNMDIGKIYDIIAMRVMVDTVSDCYHVLGIIHGEWTPVPNRIKDYIAMPKANGYQSLHTTIFTGTGGIVEIQIRTHEMHEQAENGIAAHFIYKSNGVEKNPDLKELEWVNRLHDLNKEHEDEKPKEFLEKIHMNFFKDRVFIFTPKGDIIDLPDGSSIIDFAYAIHTDIGNHAQGARVNGKNSSLGTVLKTHDIVEIQVNKNTNPTSKWLDYAKTTLARREINAYLKQHSLLSKFLSFGKN
ncbi:MAG: GTP pyrophosphokinase [Candidatus Nomurabacteria bacterium GW2011_GWD2_36_14]|nr:MAG: GTP pyrophosphokinase [Candidatus Nomurabacteria bacterium GW2011_GWD2_36_14]KKP99556.1 MAG: GTP pyrophosphokinase [Candidatus Nomurabacteria bacterium GW2011_GWF2_36_19]